MTANYCSHIEEHTDDAIYSEIEKEVVFKFAFLGKFLEYDRIVTEILLL